MEVGFGNGQHLVELAKRNPDKLIIGSEVYENGVANTCFSLFQNNIENVRIFHGDVRLLLNSLEHQSIDRIYILFPDPWIKKRHNSRRLLSQGNIQIFFETLKSKSHICIATDIEDYYQEIDDTFSRLKEFKKLEGSPKEKNLNFFLDSKTKYEKRAINKGLHPSYVIYKKI